jgi:hypothetical protein
MGTTPGGDSTELSESRGSQPGIHRKPEGRRRWSSLRGGCVVILAPAARAGRARARRSRRPRPIRGCPAGRRGGDSVHEAPRPARFSDPNGPTPARTVAWGGLDAVNDRPLPSSEVLDHPNVVLPLPRVEGDMVSVRRELDHTWPDVLGLPESLPRRPVEGAPPDGIPVSRGR